MLTPKKPMILMLLLVAAAATALLVPFMVFGNASGHDFEFHLASWMDVVHQWHQRVLYPRWAELANWGYGEPRFIFYPPASWLLGGALSLALPWPMVPGAFYWICMVVAGACMYRLAREWFPETTAMLAALVYAVNPYQQLLVYWRSDFAEMMVGSVLPLLVLYAWRAAQGDRRSALWLAAAFGAVWLMNAPAAVVATYSVALLLVVTAIECRCWRGLLLGGGAMAVGFGLAATYIIPAAYEQEWVNIGEVLSSGLRPIENFLFTSGNDPEHTYFNWKVSTVAVAAMLVAALVLIPARRFREHRGAWWPLLTLLGVSAVLMFRVTVPAWNYLPELHFVQFPWRWLLTFNVVLVWLIAAASRSRPAVVWAGCILAMTVCAVALTQHAWWDSDGVNDLRDTILVQAKGYFGVDEYGVRGSDHYDLEAGAPRVKLVPVGSGESKTKVHVRRWSAERKSFTVRNQQPVTAVLRLMSYPAWQVSINGQTAGWSARPNTKEISVELPPGENRVEVRFTRTPDRTLGNAISLAMVACWLLLFLQQRGMSPVRTTALAGHSSH